MRISDLPFVFLSYDEPWADEAAEQLRLLVPDVIRVHGVKGLDACHKAAADAAGTEYFVTVDADTKVSPSFLCVTIPACLESHNVRLHWYSRNMVNGLPSGNGSLKVWPRALVMAMRSHEAAPPDRVSIDHDLGDVIPGLTRATALPGIFASSDPARTPEHAFRAGLREAVYLNHLVAILSAKFGSDSHRVMTQLAVLTAWLNLGRHVRNGLWTMYGARLGLWLALTQPDRDPRIVNDYKAMKAIWTDWVLPRFSPGGSRCQWTGTTWDAESLELEVRTLGSCLAKQPGSLLCEFGAEQSEVISRLGLMPAHRDGDAADGLGSALLRGKGLQRDSEGARLQFEVATAMGHAAAPLNLGRMMETGAIENGDPVEITRLYRMANALGNPHAASLLEQMKVSQEHRALAGS